MRGQTAGPQISKSGPETENGDISCVPDVLEREDKRPPNQSTQESPPEKADELLFSNPPSWNEGRRYSCWNASNLEWISNLPKTSESRNTRKEIDPYRPLPVQLRLYSEACLPLEHKSVLPCVINGETALSPEGAVGVQREACNQRWSAESLDPRWCVSTPERTMRVCQRSLPRHQLSPPRVGSGSVWCSAAVVRCPCPPRCCWPECPSRGPAVFCPGRTRLYRLFYRLLDFLWNCRCSLDYVTGRLHHGWSFLDLLSEGGAEKELICRNSIRRVLSC